MGRSYLPMAIFDRLSVEEFVRVLMVEEERKARLRDDQRKAKKKARAVYSKKKHDRFVVSHRRNPSELKRKLKTQIRPWSDLTPDLLSEVLTRFSSADQIRFRCVCKELGPTAITTAHN